LRRNPGRRGIEGLARRTLPGALAVIWFAHLALATEARAAFPVESKDDRGVAVRLSREPRRLVSLAPSLTEIVFLLGQEKKLVGVTRYCNYPPRAETLPKIGGIADPDVERIVAAAPDLVLCTTDGNPREKVRALEQLGIPCFAAAPQDLAGIHAAIERIGEILGVPEAARREANALRARVANATHGKSGPVPNVLFVVSTSPIIAAGEGTFMDELVRLSGGRNAAAAFSGRYPRLSVENLLAVRPDVIFIAAMAGVEKFSPQVTRWREIPAFRDGAVVSLVGDLVTRPGPRMVTALEAVSLALSDWRRRNPAQPAEERGKR
jgi:iron complex transport system substrate-binding protein